MENFKDLPLIKRQRDKLKVEQSEVIRLPQQDPAEHM